MTRSQTPFFNNQATTDFIGTVAALKPLTVYAGAGVTIDRTGLSWAALIRRLFAEVDVSSEYADALLDALGPDRAASILTQNYQARYGHDAWRARLRAELRRLLYINGEWLVGRLTASVAALAGQRGAAEGIVVLTTNYDDYLEQTLEVAKNARFNMPSFEVRRYTRSASIEQLGHEPGVVRIVHLHGFVPDHDVTPEDFKNTIQEGDLDPVLSEDEYATAGKIYEPLLAKLFKSSSILVLGISITDPPLIRALLDRGNNSQGTADSTTEKTITTPASTPAFAVLTMQDSLWKKNPSLDPSELRRLVARRHKQLDIVPIFTDFFSQIGQFIQEVAMEMGSAAARSANREVSPIPYVERLAQWWEHWESDPTHYNERQDRDSSRLYDQLQEVRTVLEASASEKLKLELWIRWNPSPQSRKFRLWASSVGTVRDLGLMREFEIDDVEEYRSSRAFTMGRPEIIEDKAEGVRWKTYLVAPVRATADIAGAKHLAEVIVAIITFASMEKRAVSALKLDNQASLETVATLLETTALAIVDPNGLKRKQLNSSGVPKSE